MFKINKFKIVFGLILIISILVRFIGLNKIPPSPYWEEVALGVDAFSILKTGRDHHGHYLPLVAFESFGDYKPSLYFYSIIPFIKFIGLNILAVRLPATISGVIITLGVYYLIKIILSKNKNLSKKQINFYSLLAFFIVSINPWAIQFSRAAWEVNLATALILWGIISFLKFIQTKKIFYIFAAALLLSLSMYAYHAARIIAPLLGSSLAIIYFKETKYNFKKIRPLLFVGLLSFILISPILISLNKQVANQRFKETSLFYDLEPIIESNQRQELANHSFLGRIFYHRYILFSEKIIKNYFSYFNLNYLLISGDINPRHSAQYFGLFYPFEIILLLAGAYLFIKNFNKYHGFLLAWLLISIFPAAISKTNPHALRTLISLPVWIYLIILGAIQLKKYFKYFDFILVITYFLFFIFFMRFYSQIYPKLYANEWQYGYEKLVNKINFFKENNNKLPIYISREYGRPAMYYWFYSQTSPGLIQAWNLFANKDQGEFLEFENFKFGDPKQLPAIVASSKEAFEINCSEHQCTNLDQVTDLRGQVIWEIYRME